MPEDTQPPSEETARLHARQKSSATLACSLLVLVGIALLVLPIDRIPLPARIAMAVIDFIAAAGLWLLARQKFGEK